MQLVESGKLHCAYVMANCSLCVCSGQIGFLLCTKKGNSSVDPQIPKREPSAAPSKDYPALRYACPCALCLHQLFTTRPHPTLALPRLLCKIKQPWQVRNCVVNELSSPLLCAGTTTLQCTKQHLPSHSLLAQNLAQVSIRGDVEASIVWANLLYV